MSKYDLRSAVRDAVESEKLTTYKALAKEAGIGNAHLSNFMNEKRGLSPAAQARLQQALESLLDRAAAPQVEQRDQRDRYLDFLVDFGRGDFRFMLDRNPSSDALAKAMGHSGEKFDHPPGGKKNCLTSINVAQVFVEPRFHEVLDHYAQPGEPVGLAELEERACAGIVHILGPVGCGKTMLVRHRVSQLAQAAKAEVGSPFPILFPLNVLNRFQQTMAGSTLFDLIVQWYGSYDLAVGDLLLSALESGQAYVFMDGLDEAADNYEQTIALIDAFSRRFRGNRILVTQRGTPPYGAADVLQHSSVFECLEFDREQKEMLVQHWRDLFMQAGEWQDNAMDRKNLQRFLEYLDTDSEIKELAVSPFLLTLITIMFFRDRWSKVTASANRARLFRNFFELCLGSSSQRRSLDGLRAPLGEGKVRPGVELLSRLAWKAMVRDDRLLEAMAPQVVIEVFKEWHRIYTYPSDKNIGAHEAARSAQWAQDFLDFLKDAGLLRFSLLHERSLEFGFQEELFRDWFLSVSLLNEPQRLALYQQKCVEDPTMAVWQGPVALALAQLESIGRISELQEAVDKALTSLPFAEVLITAGLPPKAFFNVMPLGLDLCLEALRAGELTPSTRQRIVRSFRQFYESTPYAVVTHCLRPLAYKWIVLNEEMKEDSGWEEIPVDIGSLQEQLELHRDDPDEDWVAWMDRIWRYQVSADCFQLLFREVKERLGESKSGTYQMLRRRIAFGVGFVGGTEIDQGLQLLTSEQDEDISTMAKIRKQVLRSKKVNAPAGRQKLDECTLRAILQDIQGQPVADCVFRLSHREPEVPLRAVLLSADHILEEVWKIQAEADIKAELQSIILDDTLLSKERSKERSIAIVLLHKTIRKTIHGKVWENENWDSFLTLLRVASKLDEKSQFANIEGCQVYDIAAWSIRGLFRLSGHLVGLDVPSSPADTEAAQVPALEGLPILDVEMPAVA